MTTPTCCDTMKTRLKYQHLTIDDEDGSLWMYGKPVFVRDGGGDRRDDMTNQFVVNYCPFCGTNLTVPALPLEAVMGGLIAWHLATLSALQGENGSADEPPVSFRDFVGQFCVNVPPKAIDALAPFFNWQALRDLLPTDQKNLCPKP